MKKIATFKNPSIEACIKGLYRFKEIEGAKKILSTIKDNFETSSKFEQTEDKITIWVKGFDINEEDKENGYLGNFADFTIEELEDHFTIKVKKRKIELKYHPQKKRAESIHPNWGHPILRDIKKGKEYNNVEDAFNELKRLHIEYDKTSIPTGDKLFIIIYEVVEGKKEKTHKYILEVKPHNNGKFIIAYHLNKKSEIKDKVKKLKSKSQDKDVKGFFTAKEKAKTNARKNGN